jgi:L-asparaginase type II
MSLVKIVATGGTVANTVTGRIGVDELLRDIPEAQKIANLEIADILRLASWEFTPSEWLKIARAVADAADDQRVNGIVVTHGTLTAEETAYFLHLVVNTRKPIVIVCAQRRHRLLGNDGDRNFVDAVRIAASEAAHDKGVLITLGEEIHSAREVMKTNQRPGGFVSRGAGLLGHVESDQVTFCRAPTRRHTAQSAFNIRDVDQLPRVDIVASYPGADHVPIRALVEAGCQGLVVDGYAYSGKPTAAQEEELKGVVKGGIPVVCANRGRGGRIPVVPVSVFVQGDDLVANKARILLMLALTKTTDRIKLQSIFSEY